MVLALKGYNPLRETGFYVGLGTHMVKRREIYLPAKNVIALRKFTCSTEDDVVDNIRLNAFEIKKNPHQKFRKGGLEEKLRALPENVLEEIRNNNEEKIIYIRQNTLAPRLKEDQEPDQHIIAKFGLLTEEVIDEIKDDLYIFDEDDLLLQESLGKFGLGQRWFMNILLEKGELPDFNELKVLVKNKVMGSETLALTIITPFYPENEIMHVLQLLYESVKKENKIKEIKDASPSILEQACIEPIESMKLKLDKRKERYYSSMQPFIIIPNPDN